MEPLELVRLLIPDVDDTNQIFTDTQINGYLQIAGNNVRRAAALAIRAIAVDEALLFKVVRTDDQQVNGALVAQTLLNNAKRLEDEADREDALTANENFELIFPCDDNVPPELGGNRGSWTFI